MPNKLAENKQRICFTIRRDLAKGGKELAEKQGLTFSGLISHLLALALQKSKTE